MTKYTRYKTLSKNKLRNTEKLIYTSKHSNLDNTKDLGHLIRNHFYLFI